METQNEQFYTHACMFCSANPGWAWASVYGGACPTCVKLAMPPLFPPPNLEAASQAVMPYDTSNTKTALPPDETCSPAFFPIAPASWSPATDAAAPLVSQEQLQLFTPGADDWEASLSNGSSASTTIKSGS